jgi:hypothetical protein
MAEADDGSNTWLGGAGVPGCAARLEVLNQIGKELADPAVSEDVVTAWNAAESEAIAALTAAPARTLEKLAVKCEWMARLLDPQGSGNAEDVHVMIEMMVSLARDARALVAASR